MAISEKIQRSIAQSSWIRRMFEEGAALKQRYGKDSVFDLSLGNPIAAPPPEFSAELRKLCVNPEPGMHQYMENAGYAATRAAVAAQLSRESGVSFTQNEIVMTCGAAGGLNVVLKTILNPGDEVILFAPYFVEYVHYIENHNGIAKVLPSDENFAPRLDLLEESIGSRTRAVIINSPNNPTGAVYEEEFLGKLGALLARKSAQSGAPVYLISDEAYRRIVFEGLIYPHVWRHYPDSIAVTSHSKDLSLPGERIGYIALNPACRDRELLINGFIFCNRILGFVNAPALMQRVVSRIQGASVSIADYQRKRDFMFESLTGMGYSMVKPRGAFYIFPRCPSDDDVAFVKELQEHLVLTVPGRGFGLPGYFRIAYCVPDSVLEGSLPGFRKAMAKFKSPSSKHA